MFERFTHESKDLIQSAHEHARRLDHLWVGTEHLLLALASSPGGVAGTFDAHGLSPARLEGAVLAHLAASDSEEREALQAIGIDLDRVREALELESGPSLLEMRLEKARQRFPRAWRRSHRPLLSRPFTSRAKRALELALQEALRLKHKTIEPEHIALGILRQGAGVAGAVLDELAIETDSLRADLETSLRMAS